MIKSVIQICRRPIKTLLGVLLMVLAGGILSLTAGQYWSAYQVTETVKDSFSVLAFPNESLLDMEAYKDGQWIQVQSSCLSQEDEAYIKALPQSASQWVKEISRTDLVSARIPQMQNINPGGLNSAWNTSYDDNNYDTCILEVELTGEGQNTMNATPYYEGKIISVISIHKDFADAVGKTVQIRIPNYLSFSLQIGERYLVCGDYSDSDWWCRKQLSQKVSLYLYGYKNFGPWDIVWERDLKKLSHPYTLNGASYSYAFYLEGKEYVCDVEDDIIHGANGATLSLWLNDAPVTVEHIPQGSTAEELMAQSQQWQQTLHQTQVRQSAFAVLATDRLSAMYAFAAQTVTISEGRAFTRPEEKNGAAVCLISETIATQCGLQVGDTITVEYFEPTQDKLLPYYDNLPTYKYYVQAGFAQTQEYTIVGLYRRNNEWAREKLSFSINTVIVPRSSVTCKTLSETVGIYTSLLLQTSDISAFTNKLLSDGYEGKFDFFDPGYESIADSISGYEQISMTILVLGVVAWLVILILFVLLYPLPLRQDAVRMWRLGAKKRHISAHIFVSGISILLPAAIAAFAGSVQLSEYFLTALSRVAQSELVLEITPWQIGFLCTAAFAVQAVVLALVGCILAHKSKEE